MQLYWKVYIFIIVLFVFCKKDEDSANSEPEPPFSLECNILVLDKNGFQPTDQIFIPDINAEHLKDVNFEVWYKGSRTDLQLPFLITEENKPFFYVPIHPIYPIVGGALEIRFTDKLGQCHALSLTVEELPQSANESIEIVNNLVAHIKDQIGQFGFQLKDLEKDWDKLPSQLVPLAVIYDLLANEQNLNSFNTLHQNKDVIEGETLSKAQVIDLVDRLFAKYNFDLLPNEEAEQLNRRQIAGLMNENCSNLSHEDIIESIKYLGKTYSDIANQNGKIQQNIKNASKLLYLSASMRKKYPTVELMSAILSTAYFKMIDAMAHTHVIKAENMEWTNLNASYTEENCQNIDFTKLRGQFTNREFSIDADVWKEITNISQIAPNLPALSSLENNLKLINVLNPQNVEFLKGHGILDESGLKLEPLRCDFELPKKNEKYGELYGIEDSEKLFVNIYDKGLLEPCRTGNTRIQVILNPILFGEENQFLNPTQQIKIKPIVLEWQAQDEVLMGTESMKDVKFKLINSSTNDVKVTFEKGNASIIDIAQINDSTFLGTVRITSPSDPKDFPYEVYIDYDFENCLNCANVIEDKKDTLRIVHPAFEILGNLPPCLEPFTEIDFDLKVEPPFQESDFRWSVIEDESDKTVNWFIDQNGLFTAPSNLGVYKVKATFKNDTTLSTFLYVQVSSCSCEWQFAGGPFLGKGTNAKWAESGSDVVLFGQPVQAGVISDVRTQIRIWLGKYFPEDGESLEVAVPQISGGLEDLELTIQTAIAKGSVQGINEPFSAPASLSDMLWSDFIVKVNRKGDILTGELSGKAAYGFPEKQFDFNLSFTAIRSEFGHFNDCE